MTEPLEAALTATLLELTRRNVPPDVQELLVHGDPGRVAPGALSAAVARALLAREQAAGWQPIETAPRDGTLCLFFGPRRGESSYIDIGNWYRGRWTVTWVDNQGEPTHWQPLPAPPTLPAKEPT